jgi:hypothetical protein
VITTGRKTVNLAYSVGGTSIKVVGGTSGFAVGDYIKNTSYSGADIMRITAFPSTYYIAVARNQLGTTATGPGDEGDILSKLTVTETHTLSVARGKLLRTATTIDSDSTLKKVISPVAIASTVSAASVTYTATELTEEVDTATSTSKFSVNDWIKVGEEVMYITASADVSTETTESTTTSVTESAVAISETYVSHQAWPHYIKLTADESPASGSTYKLTWKAGAIPKYYDKVTRGGASNDGSGWWDYHWKFGQNDRSGAEFFPTATATTLIRPGDNVNSPIAYTKAGDLAPTQDTLRPYGALVGNNPIGADSSPAADATFVRFVSPKGLTKHVMSLHPTRMDGTTCRHRALNYAFADGSRVLLHIPGTNALARIPPLTGVTRITPSSTGSFTGCYLYVRNTRVPTNADGLADTRALMFFASGDAAVAEYDDVEDMLSAALDVGPGAHTFAVADVQRGIAADGSYAPEDNLMCIAPVNRSILQLDIAMREGIGGDKDNTGGYLGDGFELQYIGSSAPAATKTYYAKRVKALETGNLSVVADRVPSQFVLFDTKAEAEQKLSSYTVDTTEDDNNSSTIDFNHGDGVDNYHDKARAWACAAKGIDLEVPDAVHHHSFAVPLAHSASTRGSGTAAPRLDLDDDAFVFPYAHQMESGDQVAFIPTPSTAYRPYDSRDSDSGRSDGLAPDHPHLFDPAPRGAADYAARTGEALGDRPHPAEGTHYYVHKVSSTRMRLVTTLAAAEKDATTPANPEHTVKLGGWRLFHAAAHSDWSLSSEYKSRDQGRGRLSRVQEETPWKTLYIEMHGFTANAGTMSTDPNVSGPSGVVVPISRVLCNRNVAVDVTHTITGIDRKCYMRMVVQDADGGEPRAAKFPFDISRVDVHLEILHGDTAEGRAKAAAQHEMFIRDVLNRDSAPAIARPPDVWSMPDAHPAPHTFI